MIVLDTNVISALMRREPDPAVAAWIDRQPASSIWTTSITLFEVQFGLERMPRGRRREALRQAFELVVAEDLAGRVLDFDPGAAAAAASIASTLAARGRPIDVRDVQIAGIVSAARGRLATRNGRHFEGAELELVDPWAPGD